MEIKMNLKKESAINIHMKGCYIQQIGACILELCHITEGLENDELLYTIGADYLHHSSHMQLDEIIMECNLISDQIVSTRCIQYIMTSKLDIFQNHYIYTDSVIVHALLPDYSLKLRLFRNINLAPREDNRIKSGNKIEDFAVVDFSGYTNDFIYINKLLKLVPETNLSKVSCYMNTQLDEFALLCGAGYVYEKAYYSNLPELQKLPEKLAEHYKSWGFININRSVGVYEDQIIMMRPPKVPTIELLELINK